MAVTLKAPFPWFGGKSRVAHLVWPRFGDVSNYIEPFFGSGAMLLGRPERHTGRIETVNDLDGFVANFWRAVQADPDAVARFADWPVNEVDLEARHRWLCRQPEKTDFLDRMKREPDFFDVQRAGWWVWGLCAWIGTGWCQGNYYPDNNDASNGRGVCKDANKLPMLGSAGSGINCQIPHLGDAGRVVNRSEFMAGMFSELSARLRRVRVCCGDWARITTDCVIGVGSVTGVFLDPPYASERSETYACESFTVANDVRAWALAHADNPRLRIALCGYEGEHAMPGTWECVAWKANGGYANRADGAGKSNSAKERIWFSPHCIRQAQTGTLFPFDPAGTMDDDADARSA